MAVPTTAEMGWSPLVPGRFPEAASEMAAAVAATLLPRWLSEAFWAPWVTAVWNVSRSIFSDDMVGDGGDQIDI